MRLTDSTPAGWCRGRCTESRLRSRTTSTSRGSGRPPALRSSTPPPPAETPKLCADSGPPARLSSERTRSTSSPSAPKANAGLQPKTRGGLVAPQPAPSSGSAASVAAGLSFAALGSDTGGSIRVPAAFCGVVGIRPTAGTIPRDGLVRLSRLDELGPLTRTAEDAAIVFHVLCGRPARAAVSASIADLRLGVCAYGLDAPEIEVAVNGFCDTLHGLGARLSAPYALDLGGAASALWTIAGADAAERWLERVQPKRNLIHPLVTQRIVAGAEITDEALRQAWEQARRIAAELERIFDEVDVLALPVAACSGYPLGARSLDIAGRVEDVSTLVTRYTPLASIGGLPALVLPCGTYDDGMPVGVQLVAAAGNDDLLLEIACRYQQATGWHERVPNEVRAVEHTSETAGNSL